MGVTMARTGPRHATPKARGADAGLPAGLALVIWLVSFVCVEILHGDRVVDWWALAASVAVPVCSFGFMTAIGGWPDGKARSQEQQWTTFLVFAVLILSVIRVLLPVSLSAGQSATRTQLFIVAGGVLALFLSMQLTIRCPRQLPRRTWFLTSAIVACCALVASAVPGRASVMPAQPRSSHSMALLLAVAVIGFLAWYLFPTAATPATADKVTGRLALRRLAEARVRLALPPADEGMLSGLVPAVVAVGFFSLTRDLGTSLALLVAGVSVVMVARLAVSRLWLSLSSAAVFAAGAALAIGFGMVLRVPRFSFPDVLGYSDRQPVPFRYGDDLLTGPGIGDPRFMGLWHGKPGSGSDVLAVTGHETGLLGYLGLLVVFALLFIALARLTACIGSKAGTAVAWGLIVFLVAQAVLAMETLFPGGVPIGEGPPLLSGGWADYLADLIAIGIVIGLSRRGRLRPPVSAGTRQQQQQQSPAGISS
jgi:cell division protein FtsW